jgi:ribosome-binding protein aMBF1 (putative translation factor)
MSQPAHELIICHDTRGARKMNRNNNGRKRVPPGVPFDRWLEKELKDPEFKRAYDELAPEFDIVSQIIALRLQRNLSQRDLAARMGTPQPSIARMESTRAIKNLDFVRRVADALDARLEVRLVPRELAAQNVAKSSGRRARTKERQPV